MTPTTVQSVHRALAAGPLTYQQLRSAIVPLCGERALPSVQNACKALVDMGCAANVGDPSLARIQLTDAPLPMAERKPGGKGHGLRVRVPERRMRIKGDNDRTARTGRPATVMRPDEPLRGLKLQSGAPGAVVNAFADLAVNAEIERAMLYNDRMSVVRVDGKIRVIGGCSVPVGCESICVVKRSATTRRWWVMAGVIDKAWEVTTC